MGPGPQNFWGNDFGKDGYIKICIRNGIVVTPNYHFVLTYCTRAHAITNLLYHALEPLSLDYPNADYPSSWLNSDENNIRPHS